MKAFVIAEHSDAALRLCADARTLADEVALVCFEGAPEGCADVVYLVNVPEDGAIDDAAETILPILEAGIVLAEPTRRIKVLTGKLAAAKGAAVIPAVIELVDGVAANLFYGGVGVKRQKAADMAFYFVASQLFAESSASGANAVEELTWVAPAKPIKVVGTEQIVKSGVDLTKASVVVSAGRGFAEEADLDLARNLCGKLGAGLGCTRPLTEGVNWLPTELYVGVSGLMLAPKVYIACGISGQMQHMVGCNRADTIFAINKDKNAPIFKQCDYGLIGDIKTVLPAVTAAL